MKLEGQIDSLLDALVQGQTYRELAEGHGVSISTLHNFLNLPEHSARTKAALALSAAQYADKAEQVLLDAPADKLELMRARELSQHYRWKAGKRDPNSYGDKMAVTGADGAPLVPAADLSNLSPEDLRLMLDLRRKMRPQEGAADAS